MLNNIDCVPSNVQSSHQEALLYVFEDNEAVIKMIMNGRSPTMRHVSRTHRVALDWLFDRINLDPKIQIKYIDTKNQLADMLTKGNFTRDEWNHLLCLFNTSHFSSTVCSDFVPSNVQSCQQEALLYVFGDNEAVIKMIIKGRSPTMRHVSRTHRVALDWLFDRINLDPKIQIKYIDTKNQFADILTKGNFTRDEWNHLLCLFNVSHFSSTDCSEVMSKIIQKDSGEETATAKSKPMMNLVSRCSERTLVVLPSTASESPEKTRHESQFPLSPQT